MAIVPRETTAVSVQVLLTAIHQFTVSLHSKPHTLLKMYVCLTVICSLHFWRNDLDLLHGTTVTREWNGYRNKRQYREMTLEKKFSRRSCRNSNQGPFDHESGALITELSLLPILHYFNGCVSCSFAYVMF